MGRPFDSRSPNRIQPTAFTAETLQRTHASVGWWYVPNISDLRGHHEKSDSILLTVWITISYTHAFDAAEGAFPTFKKVVLDPNIGKVCYAVTLVDVDGDGKQDIVAVTENQVFWYQAPDWHKRVIIKDQTKRDNVCIAPYDIDVMVKSILHLEPAR